MDVVTIGIVIVLLLIAIRFVSSFLKTVLKIALLVVIGFTVLYIVKPSVLENFLGKENVEWIVGEAGVAADSVSNKIKTELDSVRTKE